MKLLKISVFLIALTGFSTSLMAQKFGYVNSTAILAELPQVKQADANLEALQKQLQKKGQGMIEQLQKDYAEIQKRVETGDITQNQQTEEAKKLEARQQEIAKFEQDMVSQIQTKRAELLKPIMDKVNKAIQDVAKENGFQFIFDQQVLLYSDASQDVTAQVRTKLGI